ncbi:MAG: protein kinase [Acidobacteriota bacterium]|nr:protein kinase [Acidobacteriota bacterium]
MKLSAGYRLGPYEILALIAAGGMGEVYRARDTRLGREVAIKVVPDRMASDPKMLHRFEQEARAIAALSHPNILAIHDFERGGEMAFVVTELLRGESLDQSLMRERMAWRKAVEIATAVTDGLASAHSRGIIHRDLKPANIFLTADGQVKILDFGLAKQTGPIGAGSQMDTEPGTVLGTIGYMSPEQVSGEIADARSDIFSLGCILYELLTAQRAFQGSSGGATLAAILRDHPKDLSEFDKTIPQNLVAVVRRCLQKNPDERFQSARDLSFALREIASGSGIVEVTAGPRRRVPPLLWIAGAVIVIALSALVVRRAALNHFARTPQIHSLAVLPLTNVSGDPQQDFLADGITEQLISDLAQVEGMRVTSRTSVMLYKGSKESLAEISKKLGVDTIVEGSIVRSGDRVKVTAELVNAKKDEHLWAQTYERDLQDVLTLQRDIARAVAQKVQIQLTPAANARLNAQPPRVDPKGYDAYVRGRYYLAKASSADRAKAVEQFQQALDADPTYAPAYSGLGEAYAQMGYYNDFAPIDTFPKAKAAANRALDLDPRLAEAHACLGFVHMYYDWDFPAADAEFRKAISLNPNLATAHQDYGIFLAAMLRSPEAIREMDTARSLDPLSTQVASSRGFVLYYVREYPEAAKALQDAIAMSPKATSPHFWLGRVYQAQGKLPDALVEFRTGESGWIPTIAGLGYLYGRLGQRNEALEILQSIDEQSQKHFVTPYAPALIYLGLGDKEKALEFLARSFNERSNWLVWLLQDPRWDAIRSEPRFQEIVRKVGFPPVAIQRQLQNRRA